MKKNKNRNQNKSSYKSPLALQDAEQLTSDELADYSIVWHPDEFRAALSYWFQGLKFTIAERRAWIRATDPDHCVEESSAESDEFFKEYLDVWFLDRYESHAVSIGTLHQERFRAMIYFFETEQQELFRRGLLSVDADGSPIIDENIIKALVAIEIEPYGVPPLFSLSSIIKLQREIKEGRAIRFFSRTPYEGPESIVYDREAEDRDMESLEEFLEMTEGWEEDEYEDEEEYKKTSIAYSLIESLPTALAFRYKLGEDPPCEDEIVQSRNYVASLGIPPLCDTEAWLFWTLAQETDEAPVQVPPEEMADWQEARITLSHLLASQAELAYRFIQRHFEILEHRGLVEGKHLFSTSLLQVLALTPPSVEGPEERLRDLDINDVLELVEQLDLAEAADNHAANLADWQRTSPRNGPCPCDSGRKFKNCCYNKPPPSPGRRIAIRWDHEEQDAEVDSFLRHITSFCYTSAILTLVGEEPEPFVIDLKQEEEGSTRYGYSSGHELLLKAKLREASERGGALLLRSFLGRTDSESNLPFKEIRGWRFHFKGKRLQWEALSPQELRQACETDAETGAPLPPEPAVLYR